jgi:diguanylate cyclase (GGDEF)-like protein
VRGDGTIARMGGDEFTVLVEDVTDQSDAIRAAQRIQSALTRPFLLEGLEVFKSASIGIALTSPETSAEAVLQNADIAMYRAKDQGKACSELFRPHHARASHEPPSAEADLRYALQNENSPFTTNR